EAVHGVPLDPRADVVGGLVVQGRPVVAAGALALAREEVLAAGDGGPVGGALRQRPQRLQRVQVGDEGGHLAALRLVDVPGAQRAGDAVGQGRAAAEPAVRRRVPDAPQGARVERLADAVARQVPVQAVAAAAGVAAGAAELPLKRQLAGVEEDLTAPRRVRL